jgi:protein arginine N-methyltransferase 1
MYSIFAYGSMIGDRVRMDAYVRALRAAVKPDSIVLDIGTGTGIFAMLACQFGARKVYAIEPDDAILIAREIARANGYAGRIEFFQNLSTEVTLPERADVIISDLGGILPCLQQHLPAIADARKRLLAAGGTLIPQRTTLWTAVVDAPDLYDRYTGPWDRNSYGLDMRAARRIATNTWRRGRVAPEQILLKPQAWATLDYTTLEEFNVCGGGSWTAEREGTAHGLTVWFDAVLAKGVHLTNAPGETELVYGSAFFPWSEPVPIFPGDTISVMLRADLLGADYTWQWEARILDHRRQRIKGDFKQSTFFSEIFSRCWLNNIRSDHVPVLNPNGEIDQVVLSMIDGENSLAEIAKEVAARFPGRFENEYAALTHIGELSQKYSQKPTAHEALPA